MANNTNILPLFDTIDNIQQTNIDLPLQYPDDYQYAKEFLISYNGSQATFNAYRREVERLLHWSWKIAGKSVCDLRRIDIEDYLKFCQKPPASWIGLKKVPRFINDNGLRVPNSNWKPFVVTLPKATWFPTKIFTLSHTK